VTGHGIYDHHSNPLDAIKTIMTLCDAYVMKPLEQTRLLELSPLLDKYHAHP